MSFLRHEDHIFKTVDVQSIPALISSKLNVSYSFSKLPITSSQVGTAHKACKRYRVPTLGFAETADIVLVNGPSTVRRFASFAR